MPLSYSDMALGYPALFVSAEAARKALGREIHALVDGENPGQPGVPKAENPGQISIIRKIANRRMSGVSGVSAIRYRHAGSRGPNGELIYDPSRIDPLPWLNQRLGEVVQIGSGTPATGLDVDAPEAEPEFAGSFAAEPAVLERIGSPERSFPRGFAWLAARFGRFDLLEGLDVEPNELVPPAFPLGFIEHTIQAPRTMPWRSPTN